jgi:hypothetical protein
VYANITYRTKVWSPAAVGSTETAAIIPVKKGERVLWASAVVLTAAAASTDTTVELGDGTDTDGFIAAIDLEANAAGTYVNGAGALLASSGGKLYTADDTIDAKYAGTTFGATTPKLRFTVAIVKDVPYGAAV